VNHLTEEQLVLYHYGDAATRAEAAAVEEHLHSCATCQADLDGVRRTLDVVDSLPVPERSEGYGSEVWSRIQPRLARPVQPWRLTVQEWFVPRRLALAGGVAVLVVAAFVAGRLLPNAPPPTPATSPAAVTAAGATQTAAAEQQVVRERILLVAVGDHLERSQVALIELLNMPEGARVDISSERDRARELVSANRLYRQTALTTGDRGVADVLDDLERALVEIANSPSTMTAPEFEQVRKRIEQQGIVFKVRVFGELVRERETRPVNDARVRG
jgi:hypothetical protein